MYHTGGHAGAAKHTIEVLESHAIAEDIVGKGKAQEVGQPFIKTCQSLSQRVDIIMIEIFTGNACKPVYDLTMIKRHRQ